MQSTQRPLAKDYGVGGACVSSLISVLCLQGVHVCGQDNCDLKSGGRWDDTDDCCERRCSASQPCAEGQGHCESDQDCARPGWARCGDNLCLNSQYFPLAQYPNNSAWFGFTSSGSHFSRLGKQSFSHPRF